MRSSVALCLLFLVSFSFSLPVSRQRILSDLHHVEHDLSELRHREAKAAKLGISDAAFIAAEEPYENDKKTYGSGAIDLSLNGGSHTFYRGKAAESDHLIVIQKGTSSRLSSFGGSSSSYNSLGSSSYNAGEVYWTVRWYVGETLYTSSGPCKPLTGGDGLSCRIRNAPYTFVSKSPSSIMVTDMSLATNLDLLAWRQDFTRDINSISISTVIGSTMELIQLYESEISRALRDGATTEGISRRFNSARIGQGQNIVTYQREWEKKKPSKGATETADAYAKRLAGDKTALDAMANALADSFKSLEQWATTVSTIFKDPANTPKHPFKDGTTSFVGPIAQNIKSSGQSKLTESTAKQLRSGTDAGADAASKLLGNFLKDYQKGLTPAQISTDPSIDASKLIGEFDNGNMKKMISAALYDSISSNDALSQGLNDVNQFAERAQNAAKDKVNEIGDYFKNFVGLGKKKAATATAVNNAAAANGGTGVLKPGEDNTAAKMFDAAASKDSAELTKKAETWKFKSKFSFQPDFKFALPGSGATAMSYLSDTLKAVKIGTKLEISKGKTNAALEIKAKVNNPLNPETATADLEVSLKGSTQLSNGGTLAAGATARGTVLGLYKSPELQSVIIDTFITYASSDGRLQTGLFTTINLPLTQNANQATYFKQGAEATMRATFSYNSSNGKDSFTAFAQLKASQQASLEYAVGARYEHKFLGGAFFAEASAGGGNNRDFGGNNMRPDVRASIGLTWRF